MARVLIVDDDQATLASLARAFRLAGHEAVVCDNVNRAVTHLRDDRFDLAADAAVKQTGKTGDPAIEIGHP